MHDENMQRNEMWQFLRHCRNAATHNGRFIFKGNKPKCSSKWGAFEITEDLEGKKLFKIKKNEEEGLISIGDPIRLLWDLEQKFFQ